MFVEIPNSNNDSIFSKAEIKLYNDILNSLYEITDLVIDELMLREDISYTYDKRCNAASEFC